MVYNSVLKTTLEVVAAKKRLREMNLFPHHGAEKSWDTIKMIEIISKADKNAPILDFGCNGSPILPMLKRLGFRRLYGCDLVLKPKYNSTFMKIACQIYKREYLPILQMYDDSALNLTIQSEKTNYPDEMFEYITCLSVIEHGINMTEYFKEMARILKKDGYLLISTDYWPDKITNTKNIISNINPDNVFSKDEIESIVQLAERCGLRLIEPIDYTYKEKVVRWKKTKLDYTFIFFGMKKVEEKSYIA